MKCSEEYFLDFYFIGDRELDLTKLTYRTEDTLAGTYVLGILKSNYCWYLDHIAGMIEIEEERDDSANGTNIFPA